MPQPAIGDPKVTKQNETLEIEFTSQRWQNTIWNHRMLLRIPKGAEKIETAILFITGDGPKKGDFVDLNLLAAATGMPIAMLFNIPNQPLWDMKEDDLIAHTFTKYLETQDESWPLLFPMTKAAVSSMDVVQKVGSANGLKIKKFVVTGASKRGWTTWLTAASQDPRIAGIAPMVFDNLKFDDQMKKQLGDWKSYSEQIEDYTRRGLQAELDKPVGRKLMSLVDPFFYKDDIKVPILIVNGTNDRYWTVDAHKVYLKDLLAPTWLLELPNSGHGLEDRARLVSTVGAFARSLNGDFEMPVLTAQQLFVGKDSPVIKYGAKSSGLKPLNFSIWKAESDSKDFRNSKWMESKFDPAGNSELEIQVEGSAGKYIAAFVEARYSAMGRSFTISSPVDVNWIGSPFQK